jgi:hypothetical protein
VLFAIWFASGIVLMYARMPRLAPGERLARLAPLDLSLARMPPDASAQRHHLSAIERVRVGMFARRPVYRFLSNDDWTTVFADNGERMESVTAEQAVEEARRFAPECRSAAHDALIVDPDQWTLELRRTLPLHRIALGGCNGAVVYVRERTGEIVLMTTAAQRRVAYAGAVLHWLYFTPLRVHTAIWSTAVIWLSAGGSVMCLLGLAWGVSYGLRSPYRGWLRWHHYAGLLFGVFTFGWVFSGMLSMDPWDWHPSTTPTREQRDAFAGGSLDLAVAGAGVRASGGGPPREREIDISSFRGEPRVLVDGRAAGAIADDRLLTAARDAMHGVEIADRSRLDAYDAYYYDRDGELPLPVLRVRFADSAGTWLYLDPARGAILRREERLSRLNRWLYHGLHSLDFPILYYRRPLWDLVVIVLSLGGMASVATATAPAWRRLRRLARRPSL